MDLNKLEVEREDASFDKAELFDFYHKWWAGLVEYARTLQDRAHESDDWK